MPALRDQIADWLLRRRAPEAAPVRLTQRRIYILPTSGGLLLGMTLLLMLMGCINYNLGLGYVLTFLLAGIGLVSILHTFRNLAQLELRPGRADPVFAGEQATYPVLIDNPTPLSRIAVAMLPVHALLGETNAAFCDPAPLGADPLRRAHTHAPARPHASAEVARVHHLPAGAVSRLVLRRAGLELPDLSQAGGRRPCRLPPPQRRRSRGHALRAGSGRLRRSAPLRAWRLPATGRLEGVRPRPAHHDQTVQRAGSRRAVVDVVRSARRHAPGGASVPADALGARSQRKRGGLRTGSAGRADSTGRGAGP